ncbi:hypothetical protein ACIP88_05115 [Streptomyces uncialis]|uniref:hypothetical protein n=1 Tax=Streptomyces uncialis TaxID=1048205 RepID=UPI0038031EC7
MALYSVRRTDRIDWDEYDEVVVRASSESAALSVVLSNGMSGFMADGSNACVELIPVRGPRDVICASFNAG